MDNNPLNSGRSFGMIALSFVSIIFVLIISGILALPMLLSTQMGTRFLIQKIQGRAPVTLSIASLSLEWFGTQEIKGLYIENAPNQLLFQCPEVKTDAPLWKVLLTREIGTLSLSQPVLKMSKPFLPMAAHNTEILKAGFSAMPAARVAMPALKISLRGCIAIDQGKIDLNSPGMAPIAFDQIHLLLELPSREEISLKLHALTLQEKTQGEIDVEASAAQLSETFPTIALRSSMDQLPVQGIDQIFSLFYPQSSGLLLSALGTTLHIDAELHAAKGNAALNLNVRSTGLSAQMNAQSLEGILSLKNPATINFTLTPDVFKHLAKLLPALEPLALTQAGVLQCTLPQFTVPLPSSVEDLFKSAFSLSIAAPAQMPFTLNGKPISLDNLVLTSSSQALIQGIQSDLKGGITANGKFAPFSLQGKLYPPDAKGNTGELAFHFAEMPTSFIGEMARAPLDLYLGNQIDLQGSLTLNPTNSQIHCAVLAPRLNIPSLDVAFGDSLSLLSPAPFNFQLTPELLKSIAPSASVQLAQPAVLEGTLQNGLLPIRNFSQASLNLQCSANSLSLQGALALQVEKLNASLAIDTLDNISLEIEGSPFQMKLSGALKIASKEFIAKKPLFFQMHISSKLFQTLFPTGATLNQPAIVQCTLNPLTLPLSGFSLETLKLSGSCTIDQLALALPHNQIPISLQNAAFPFQWDGKAKSASLEVSASVKNPSGDLGTIQGQASGAQLLFSPALDLRQAVINGSLDFQNIASSFVEALSTQPGIGNLIGSAFSGKCKLQSTPDKQNISLNWTSPHLNFNTAFLIDDAAIQLQGANSQVSWTLTPDGYQVLDRLFAGPSKGLIPFELQELSTFTIALTKLNLPIAIKQKKLALADRIPKVAFDLSQLQAVFTARNPKISFFDKSSQELIQLSALAFTVDKSSGTGPLTLKLDSSVLSKNAKSLAAPTAKTGTISLSEKLTPFYDAQGNFDFSKLTSDGSIALQQFPSRLLDILARTQGRTDFPFSILFGDVINASLSANVKDFTGPLAFNVHAPNIRASLAGNLVNGALLLNESIHAQMKITPEMSRLALREINPLNLSYVYSSDPVTLEILPEGFYLPLYPFQSAKMAIPEAHLELGQITCRNEGNVGITLGLLKSNKHEKNSDLNLWFAPMALHIQKGNVDIERTEILIANTFDIAIWGQVDLAKEYVDMLLGLTASTLQKAFGVKNLPENYVLTLPMRGPMNDVQIDTSKATSKVALLLAWQKAEELGAAGGGPAGALLGGLINKMATLPDKNAKVPPPKHPYPWEAGKKKKKETSHASSSKKKHFKENDKPLKQILKVIR